jgi:hypothetical protein
MMESAVLYTFSTIPQTLGAAFAVLAAFVLYRFQGDAAVDRDIDEIMQIFTIVEHRQLLREALEEGLQKFVGQMDMLFRNPSGPSRPQVESHQYKVLGRLVTAAASQPDIRVPLCRAFIWTGVVIVGSVIVLCFEKQIAAYTTWAAVVLAVGVIGLAWCLILYWRLIEPLISARRW